MNTNPIDFSKILNLSDEDLKNKISNAAVAVGANSSKLNNALKDTDKLRAMIGSLTKKDVEKLVSTIGEDKAKQITDLLDL